MGLSIRSNEKIIFTVIATANDIGPSAKALGGKYVGGQVSAAAGLGIGEKALIGGDATHTGLQPLALDSSTGLSVAGGLGFLYIEAK